MDRYKLVLSDFHIGAGQLLEDGETNPLESFIFDSRFISFLEYYSTEDFKKADVELILNGDFLNTLQVYYGEEESREVTERLAVAKMRMIFAGHPELFDALQKFAAAPHHRITYLVGNHDPALLWPAAKQEFNQRLDAAVHYPGFNYIFDGIWVEHGQQYTPANRFDSGRLFRKNKRDEVVLNLPWGSVWVIEYLNDVKKEKPWIDRVQPFSRYLLLGLFFNPLFAVPALARLVYFFFREQLSEGRWKRMSALLNTWRLLTSLSIIPPLEKEAKKILGRPGYHTVIFGHNHQPAFRRYGKDKLYVNTGTWNDIIHLDVPNLGRTRRMTYAFIDYPDKKRPRTRLKIWKGTHQTEENVIF